MSTPADSYRRFGKKYRAEHRDVWLKSRRDWYNNKKLDPKWSAKKRAVIRARGRTLREASLSAYGNRCRCCGETEPRFLTIDHKNGGGNKHRKEIGNGVSLHRWLKKNNYPKGFQCLCFQCNCGRAVNGGICPHKDKYRGNNRP